MALSSPDTMEARNLFAMLLKWGAIFASAFVPHLREIVTSISIKLQIGYHSTTSSSAILDPFRSPFYVVMIVRLSSSSHVQVSHANSFGSVYLICTLEMPTESGELVSNNTGDEQALGFLKTQYKRCRDEHSGCQVIKNPAGFIPTRVINVGCSAEPVIKLCNREQVPIGQEYATLSHCWGLARPLSLTKLTESLFKHNIMMESLPLTFQHAIKVARLFQIQYLWIDSL
jgi:hypothetical protein